MPCAVLFAATELVAKRQSPWLQKWRQYRHKGDGRCLKFIRALGRISVLHLGAVLPWTALCRFESFQGASDERCACFGRHEKRCLYSYFRRQARKMGGQWPPLCRLGDISHEGIKA